MQASSVCSGKRRDLEPGGLVCVCQHDCLAAQPLNLSFLLPDLRVVAALTRRKLSLHRRPRRMWFRTGVQWSSEYLLFS